MTSFYPTTSLDFSNSTFDTTDEVPSVSTDVGFGAPRKRRRISDVEEIPHPVRAAAVDSIIKENRERTPLSAVEQRRTKRLTMSELNDMDIDEIKKRFYAVPVDTRGPVTRFLDMLELPRNALYNLVARDTANRKLAEGDTATLGLARVNTSDVLETLGMRPGLATAVLGFIGDVVFDPLTWVGPAGWGLELTSKAGQTVSMTRKGRKIMQAAVNLAKEGKMTEDVALRSYLESMGHTAESIAKAQDKEALARDIEKTLFGGKQGRFNKVMSFLGEDVHRTADEAGKSFADHAAGYVTTASTEAELKSSEAAKAFYKEHGRPFSSGIRVIKDPASKLGYKFTTARDVAHGSGIAHIPFTQTQLSIPGFTPRAAQQAAVASAANDALVDLEHMDKNVAEAKSYSEQIDAAHEEYEKARKGLLDVEDVDPEEATKSQAKLIAELNAKLNGSYNSTTKEFEGGIINELRQRVKQMEVDPNVKYADLLYVKDLLDKHSKESALAKIKLERAQQVIAKSAGMSGVIDKDVKDLVNKDYDAIFEQTKSVNVDRANKRKQVKTTIDRLAEEEEKMAEAHKAKLPYVHDDTDKLEEMKNNIVNFNKDYLVEKADISKHPKAAEFATETADEIAKATEARSWSHENPSRLEAIANTKAQSPTGFIADESTEFGRLQASLKDKKTAKSLGYEPFTSGKKYTRINLANVQEGDSWLMGKSKVRVHSIVELEDKSKVYNLEVIPEGITKNGVKIEHPPKYYSVDNTASVFATAEKDRPVVMRPIRNPAGEIVKDAAGNDLLHQFEFKNLTKEERTKKALEMSGITNPEDLKDVSFGHGTEYAGTDPVLVRQLLTKKHLENQLDTLYRVDVPGMENQVNDTVSKLQQAFEKAKVQHNARIQDLKDRINAVQKRSAEAMDVRKQSADGERVGTTYAKELKIARARKAAEEVKPQEVRAAEAAAPAEVQPLPDSEIQDVGVMGGKIDRPMVTVKVNGVPVVFYRSSEGTSGKKVGGWFPAFGLGEGDWVIKGNVDKATGKMPYGVEELDRVSEMLSKRFPPEMEADQVLEQLKPVANERGVISKGLNGEEFFQGAKETHRKAYGQRKFEGLNTKNPKGVAERIQSVLDQIVANRKVEEAKPAVTAAEEAAAAAKPAAIEEVAADAKHIANEERWQKANVGQHMMEEDEAADFVKKAKVNLGNLQTADPAQELIDLRMKWGQKAHDAAVSPATGQRMDEVVPGWKDMNPYQRSQAMQLESEKTVAQATPSAIQPAEAAVNPEIAAIEAEHNEKMLDIDARMNQDLEYIKTDAEDEIGMYNRMMELYKDLEPKFGEGTEHAGKTPEKVANEIRANIREQHRIAQEKADLPLYYSKEEIADREAFADYLHAKYNASVSITDAIRKQSQAAQGSESQDVVNAFRVAFGLGADDLSDSVMGSLKTITEKFIASKSPTARSFYEGMRNIEQTMVNRLGLPPGLANEVIKNLVKSSDIQQTQAFQTAFNDMSNAIKAAGFARGDEQAQAHRLVTAYMFAGNKPYDEIKRLAAIEEEDEAYKVIVKAVEGGVLNTDAKRKAVQDLANKYAGVFSRLEQENPLNGRVPNYTPNVVTPQGQQAIDFMRNNRMDIVGTNAKGNEVLSPAQAFIENYQKRRSTLEHVFIDKSGKERRLLESELAYLDYTDSDLMKFAHEDPGYQEYLFNRRENAKAWAELTEAERQTAQHRFLSPLEINKRVKKEGMFGRLTNNALGANDFVYSEAVRSIPHRLGQEERDYARRLFQSYVAPHEVRLSEKQIADSGLASGNKSRSGFSATLVTGEKVHVFNENGRVVMYLGNDKYIQPSVDISDEFSPLADLFKTSDGRPIQMGFYPEPIAHLIEDTAGFFSKPKPGSQIAKVFGVDSKVTDNMIKILKGVDKISGYWKVQTLLHPSWTINDIIGNMFLMVNMGINPITAAKKSRETFQIINAAAEGNIEKLKSISINGQSAYEHLVGNLGSILGGHGAGEVERQLNVTGKYVQPFGYSIWNSIKKAAKLDLAGAKQEFTGAIKETYQAAEDIMENRRAVTPFSVPVGERSQSVGEKAAVYGEALFNQGIVRRVWQPWAHANGIANDWLKATAYFCLLEEGHNPEQAARMVSEKMLDMSVLTSTDKNMRTLIPFWNWMKNSGVLGVREFYRNPKFFTITPKVKHALEEAMNGEENLPENARPSWIRDQLAMQIGTDPNTRRAFTLTSSLPTEAATYALSFLFSPFMGAGALQDSLAYGVNSITPPLKAVYELGSRREAFTKRVISSEGGDITPTEYLLQQIRPFREFGVGSIRGGPVQRAFKDSPVMGVSRLLIGGRLQPFEEERRVQNLQKEYDERVDGLRRRIGIAEREGQKEESISRRVELLRLFNQMQGLGLTIPKWASGQISMLKQPQEVAAE